MKNSFQTPAWANGSNVYEVNLRQYTQEGTFMAFSKELPRLKAMGVEILWFMPITPISKEKRLGVLGSYYACSSYTNTNPEFGSIEDFKLLVNQAHNLSFKVIIDWVANHTGWDHHWTKEHPEFYKKDKGGNFFDANGWEDVIDLDYTNKQLRSAMMKAMKFWVTKCNIDGFRCDMAHLVPLDFWAAARTELDQLKSLFWLAETEEPSYHQVFDATYAWELLHAMEAIYKGQADIHQLDGILFQYKTIFPPHAMRLAFTSNHDENSHSGSEYERLGDGAKAFAVLTATWSNFIPLVYSGQEMPNKKRLRFFEKDYIGWTGTNWLHNFYKILLSLHRSNTALHAGEESAISQRIKTSADDKIFAFVRQTTTDRILVLLNLSPASRLVFTVENDALTGKFKSAFSGLEYVFTGVQTFEMQGWDYLVFYRTDAK